MIKACSQKLILTLTMMMVMSSNLMATVCPAVYVCGENGTVLGDHGDCQEIYALTCQTVFSQDNLEICESKLDQHIEFTKQSLLTISALELEN
ncbi:MAG: hypothetical protein KDD62_15540, partial [Bdellovibrionales bacterium]|nr:hypothetical protein [Bdellovibrionales bacterium]